MFIQGSGDQATVFRLFEEAASAVPDKQYLDFQGETFTYAEAHREIIRCARGLKELGVKRGDTVTTMLDNSAEAVFLWYATIHLGAIAVPINTAYKGTFLEHAVNDSAAKVVIAESAYLPRLEKLTGDLPNLRTVVGRGAGGGMVGALKTISLDDMRLDGDYLAPVDADPSDTACLIYTGGTTGPSKGCIISNNYMVQVADQLSRAVLRRPEESSWSCLPLFHIAALSTVVVAPTLQHASAILAPRFSVTGFWPEIKRSGAQVVILTGVMPVLLANMKDTPEMLECRGQIRALFALPVAPDTEKIWKERFGLRIAGGNGYGLTEAFLITDLPGGIGAKPGSSGRRNQDFDTRIFDENDRELGVGEVGEIVTRPLRRNRMFGGYWRRPEETLRTMRNLWFHTGDLGKFDEEGFFYFVDRKKDYLRRRGENISSYEVERAFLQHPAIAEVAAHAVLSELGEDDLKVTAVLASQATLTERGLFEWAVERVPYYALPRYIEFRAELPKSVLNRVHKHVLRDEGRTPLTWDRDEHGVKFERS